jgi:hypothetical protein
MYYANNVFSIVNQKYGSISDLIINLPSKGKWGLLKGVVMYKFKKMSIEDSTDWWTCNPTSEKGRCGVPNSCGIDTQKFLLLINGNLSSVCNYRGGPIE